MRISELYLQSFGIDVKRVRPSAILDIIDGLLLASDIKNAVHQTNKEYNHDFTGDINVLNQLVKDKVLVKLLDFPKAAKLYSKLYTSILLNKSIEIPKEQLLDVLDGVSNQNAQYKALSKALDDLNRALDEYVIIHSYYADRIQFIILKGSDSDTLINSLAESGFQSVSTVAKLFDIMAIKGLV